jgi:voltage-gated potassium channel
VVRQAVRPAAAFLGVVVGGVAGFAVLGGVGPVQATFWLVDLTSVELHFRSHAGPEQATKVFAVLVRAGMVVAGLWFGESVVTAAFGSQIREELRRVRTKRTIDDIEDHVIVCGYGMFGRTVAEDLRAAGRTVVAVERDEQEFERVPAADDLLGVQGDARREETLRAAGVDRADALVAAIDDGNANIQIAIVASQLAPELTIVVRVGEETYETLARRAGADAVVIPEVASGRQVLDRL